MRVSWNALPTL